MTAIDSHHAALLRGVAKNTNDETARKVYADWLQEQGNPGWLIVLHYRIQDWPVACTRGGETKKTGGRRYWQQDHFKLPWLDGTVDPERISDPRSRVKFILNAYADGRIINGDAKEE